MRRSEHASVPAPPAPEPARPYDSCAELTRSAYALLNAQLGFERWACQRKVGAELVSLALFNPPQPQPQPQPERHSVIPWADSLCAPVLAGLAPPFVADVKSVTALSDCPEAVDNDVRAYVVIPVYRKGPRLLGVLSGTHPRPLGAGIARRLHLAKAVACQLGTVLEQHIRVMDLQRLHWKRQLARGTETADLLEADSWAHILDREEEHCRSYAHPSAVVTVALKASVEPPRNGRWRQLAAFVAKVAGPKCLAVKLDPRTLSLLLYGLDPEDLAEFSASLRRGLASDGIDVGLGYAYRRPGGTLHQASAQAFALAAASI